MSKIVFVKVCPKLEHRILKIIECNSSSLKKHLKKYYQINKIPKPRKHKIYRDLCYPYKTKTGFQTLSQMQKLNDALEFNFKNRQSVSSFISAGIYWKLKTRARQFNATVK